MKSSKKYYSTILINFAPYHILARHENKCYSTINSTYEKPQINS